jgi:hypothetical protein
MIIIRFLLFIPIQLIIKLEMYINIDEWKNEFTRKNSMPLVALVASKLT